MEDSGSLTLTCDFENSLKTNALADSGATINLMSYYCYKKLDSLELKTTIIAIYMADRSITYPHRVIEDLLVKVGKFVFLVDFEVLDMHEDEELPIILGRHFLSTINALVDFHNS